MVTFSPAAEPVVSNVVMAQRTDGSGLVDISYDLMDADGDTMAVTLQLSDNGGVLWLFPVIDAVGDVGQGIVSGTGKNIVWNAVAPSGDLFNENFRARVLASDAGVEFHANSPDHIAITDFSRVDWTDPANIEKFSRAKMALIMGSHIWAGGQYADVDVVGQLKALNPDIVILVYVSVKSAPLNAPNENPDSFWYKWYDRTSPYFVSTTEGAMAQDFPGNRLINMIDPDCRRVMIETIKEMQDNSLNVVDGLYWDYFATHLWVPAGMDIPGDPDMDGNGIGHWDDPAEMQAYRDAQIELISATRDSLGEGFVQFFNGLRAHADSTFAALGDGAYYEIYPTQFFPDPDMRNSLDPAYPYSLFHAGRWFRTVNGGPLYRSGQPLVLGLPGQQWRPYPDHHGGQVPGHRVSDGSLLDLDVESGRGCRPGLQLVDPRHIPGPAPGSGRVRPTVHPARLPVRIGGNRDDEREISQPLRLSYLGPWSPGFRTGHPLPHAVGMGRQILPLPGPTAGWSSTSQSDP